MKTNFKFKTQLIAFAYVLLAVVLFTSCSKKVQTETEIDDASILKGTKYISTHVWIRDWKGKPLSLEYWRVDECKALEVDSVLKIHKKESSIIHKACLNYR